MSTDGTSRDRQVIAILRSLDEHLHNAKYEEAGTARRRIRQAVKLLKSELPAQAQGCFVPQDLMEKIVRTLQSYASPAFYRPARVGGILTGCPRGRPPTPQQLSFNAKMLLQVIRKSGIFGGRPRRKEDVA